MDAEAIKLDSEGVTVFQSLFGRMQFLVDQTCLHSYVNFSRMTHRISTKFRLSVHDLKWYARSVSFITGNVDNSKVFSSISGSLKICLLLFADVPLLNSCGAMFATPVSYNGCNVFELTTVELLQNKA